MSKPERYLKMLLRVVGIITGSAAFAVIMPRAWMDAVHQWLGLGPLPEGAIVDYLARSLSAFYAFLGGLQWVVSYDVRRHSNVITYLAWTAILFGIVVTVIDLQLGLPLYWTLGEGPPTLALGVIVLVLQARVKAADAP